jgi:hypothetical protein
LALLQVEADGHQSLIYGRYSLTCDLSHGRCADEIGVDWQGAARHSRPCRKLQGTKKEAPQLLLAGNTIAPSTLGQDHARQ